MTGVDGCANSPYDDVCPDSTSSSRSLFGSLVQVQEYWRRTSERMGRQIRKRSRSMPSPQVSSESYFNRNLQTIRRKRGRGLSQKQRRLSAQPSVDDSNLKKHRQSATSIELPNSESSLFSFSTSEDFEQLDDSIRVAGDCPVVEMARDDLANKTTSQTNLFMLNAELPSCSRTSLVVEKRPKLQRIGEKIKKFITQRDRQHAVQFRRLFSDTLAPDEQLISSFSCLYYNEEAERLIPGRLFASFGHLAFNANSLSVRFILSWRNNVFRVEKTNEQLLDMHGEIRIVLENGIVCSFGSLSAPDKVYGLLFRLWSTGRYLNQQQILLDNCESQSSLLIKMGGTQTEASINPTDTASEATDDIKPAEPAKCNCSEHKGQLVIDSVYPLSARQLFRFLFTENALMNEFLTSAKRTDMNAEAWADSDEKTRGKIKRKRTTTYTVELSNTWGPKTSDVTERQTFVEIGKQAVDGYVIRKEANNSGVPYADSFNIYCTYCITRITPNSCRLQVHAGLEFKKSVMGMFRGFIERMSINGINEYYKHLDTYLQANSSHIQTQLEERVSAGFDFFDASNRSSFRSLNDSNDGEGYISDLDEREHTTKKRLVRSLSYAARSNVVASHSAGIDRSLLVDINNSLRIIAFMLFLILGFQLWTSFSPKDSHNLLPHTEELLSRLISHVQSTDSLDDLKKLFSDLSKKLSN